MLFVPLLDPGLDIFLYAGLAFVMMVGLTLYDTYTDGMALVSTPEEEQGIIQGLMVGGRAAGMIIISGLLGLVVQLISWSAGFLLLAIITLLPLAFVLKRKEEKLSANIRFEWRSIRRFKQSYVIALGVLEALYSLIINGANQLVNLFLMDRLSIDLATAGYIVMVLGIGTIVGGLIGGNITDKIGQKRSTQGAVIASLIGVGLIPFISSPWLAWLLVFIFGF